MTKDFDIQLVHLVEQAMRGSDAGDLDLATSLPWLRLIRRPAPTPAGRGILTPSVCLLVQGEKEMLVGQRVLTYGPGCYVQAGVAMPVSGQVTRASEAAPYYGIRVDIDPKEVAAFVLEMGLQLPPVDADPPAITVERADDAMLDVFVRLLRLLDQPNDLPVLGRLLKQELIYRLVTAPGGATLSRGVVGGQRERAVGEAIQWIRTHYNEPLSIDALARTGAHEPFGAAPSLQGGHRDEPFAVSETGAPARGAQDADERRRRGGQCRL